MGFIICEENYYFPCDGKCYKCTDYRCENNPNSPDRPTLEDELKTMDFSFLSDSAFVDDGLPF